MKMFLFYASNPELRTSVMNFGWSMGAGRPAGEGFLFDVKEEDGCLALYCNGEKRAVSSKLVYKEMFLTTAAKAPIKRETAYGTVSTGDMLVCQTDSMSAYAFVPQDAVFEVVEG